MLFSNIPGQTEIKNRLRRMADDERIPHALLFLGNEGTGGFTEQLKTRVVMPIMFTKRQTNHVLGHELVHVFQYQSMIFGKDSTTHGNLQNLPLFMVEGLAEYMTLGREDPHTAMWLRDAVHSGDIPSIKDLITKENKYFPYRWGQVFWTYVTALYGDDIIRPLFNQTSIYGINEGFFRVFKLDIDHFSEKFKNADYGKTQSFS